LLAAQRIALRQRKSRGGTHGGFHLKDVMVKRLVGFWLSPVVAFCLFPPLAAGQAAPPTISAVSASNVAASSQIITWTTDTPSDSQVEYGTTVSYGSFSVLDTVLVTAHSVTLIGLSPATLYHYRVKSRDGAGNLATSADFTFTTSASGSGKTYYVDKTGCNDSFPGTSTQPWCTIGKAVSILAPGDTVIVRPGVYNESLVPQSGSANAYITYQGLPGAILDGTGTTTQAFDIYNQAFLIIMGFEVRHYLNPRPAGNSVNIHGTSHHIELFNLVVHDNWNGIIMQDDSNQIYISTCEVFNSRYGVGFENTVHDVFISSVVSHNNSELYIGPVSSYQNGDGFSDDLGTYNLFIQNSAAYGNQDGGFDIRAPNFSCANCISHDNVKYGFRMWDGGGPFTLINALAYGNGWFPLQLQSLGPTTYLYNSTFVNAPNDNGYAIDTSASNLVIRNTIFSGFRTGLCNGSLSGVNDDYNIYDSNAPVGFTLGAHSFNANPLFVNPTAGDFHLQAKSPAIDAGTTLPQVTMDLDGNPRPQGAGYDIGAYEFPSGAPQPPNPPTNLQVTSVK
jgi:hypothetical protein